MVRLFAGVIAFGLVSAATPAAAQDLVAQGEKIYAARKCVVCHAIGGKGNAKGPLDGVGSRLTADELRAWIVDATGMTAKTKASRKPVMPNYKLPPAELDALVAYLASLKTS